MGVTVPLFSCEHFYIVTDRIAGVHRDLPVMRDPDGYIYFKEEVGGLLMGGFEPDATPWLQSAAHRGGIPENFEFQLLPDNWDAFQILMENALHRVPAMETARIKQFYNGPESFTADNNFILGPAPGLANVYVGCGFNSMGIASSGGAGKALAEWVVQGEPTLDLWPVDIRRFARFNGNETWLPDRIKEVLGMHYKMPWPNRELESARPFRRSPLYVHLHAANASFGSKMGWERANFFAPSPAEAKIDYGWGHQNWHAWVAAEHQACRERVAVFDMSSFAKLAIKGPDACELLQRLAANLVPQSPGATVYTGLLNERGGYESDLTITCIEWNDYLVVTGSAQAVRDRDLIEREVARRQLRCEVVDVTAMYAMLAVMGPRSRELLQRISTTRFDNEAFPFGTSREIDLGYATVRATRLTYVGELGWELYSPVEFAVAVYEAVMAAGRDLGVANAGYYAIDSLRLEKGYRAWGRELTPDITPYEAGLGFAVRLDKDGGFRGHDALLRAPAAGVRKRVVSLVVDAPHTNLWGGELILRDQAPVGFVTSAAFGHTLGKPVALGVINNAEGPGRQGLDRGWFLHDRPCRGSLCRGRFTQSPLRSSLIAYQVLSGSLAMLIGVPKEIKVHEYRVGLTPSSVRELVSRGHAVCVQTGAGAGIGAGDDDYERAGAQIATSAEQVFASAEMIIKVKEPQAVERAMLREGQILFTYLHLAPDPQQAADLITSGAVCIAYETVTNAAGGLPLLAPMSEVAGRLAVQAGARCLEKSAGGMGVLLGGVAGVPPGRIVILGAGVVGTNAAQMAVGHRRAGRRHRPVDRCAAADRRHVQWPRDHGLLKSRQRRTRGPARRPRDLRRTDTGRGRAQAGHQVDAGADEARFGHRRRGDRPGRQRRDFAPDHPRGTDLCNR